MSFNAKFGAIALPFALLLVMLCLLPPLDAQPKIDAKVRQQVIDRICSSLAAGYIYPETAEKLISDLRQRQKEGQYQDLVQGKEFAHQLTKDLFALSSDKHFEVLFGPEEPPKESGGGPKSLIGRAEVLPGNIGYVSLLHFNAIAGSTAAIDHAMEALQGVEALIIDLGPKNPGGSPYIIRYVSAYLFSKRTLLALTQGRGWKKPKERWTIDHVPGERFADIPVYVLTSGKTYSAAESFVFGLKVNKRITQVGELTGGAGHWGEEVQLGHDFRMFLPKGRTYDPATGLDWEAKGVQPELEVPYTEALVTALADARKVLGASGS